MQHKCECGKHVLLRILSLNSFAKEVHCTNADS